MVHQHFMLVDTMTVAENIVLGAEPGNAVVLDIATASVEIRKLSEEFKLAVNPSVVIEQLSVGQQQRVELLIEHGLVVALILHVLLEFVAAPGLFFLDAPHGCRQILHRRRLFLHLVGDHGPGHRVDAKRGLTTRTLDLDQS